MSEILSGSFDITGTVKIPSNITEIGNNAFWNCHHIENIEIPNSVTHIGDKAFRNCFSLQSITIPESITSIGEYVFAGCAKLEEVNWESPIRLTKKSIEKLFEDCPNLKSINYHGIKIELNSKNLDKIIKENSTSKLEETIDNIKNLFKNEEEQNR